MALLLSGAACTSGSPGPGPSDHRRPPVVDGAPFRAFTDDSWWNTPLPDDAPANPQEAAILRYMSTAPEAGGGCLHLAGAQGGSWGQPVYWAGPGDPEFDLRIDSAGDPPRLPALRIPVGAESADNNDGSMTIFDVDRGYVVALTDASFDGAHHVWTASGATITYMDSDGLDARVGGELRATLRDSQAVGRVLALDPPQHISFAWDWVERPLGATSVLAFDVIDHGSRTWVTLRHVGLPSEAQIALQDQVWRYWLGRFEDACRLLPREKSVASHS